MFITYTSIRTRTKPQKLVQKSAKEKKEYELVMALIFDTPKHLVKRKPTPENKTKVATPKAPTPKAPKPKAPTPGVPTPEELSANEVKISDAENFEKLLLDETPQTPPNSPGKSKRSKRSCKNKNSRTPKKSKTQRMINLLG